MVVITIVVKGTKKEKTLFVTRSIYDDKPITNREFNGNCLLTAKL